MSRKRSPLGVERVAIGEANGRVLGERVFARHALPAFDHSSMDGYAVRASDTEGRSRESPERSARSPAYEELDRANLDCPAHGSHSSTGPALAARHSDDYDRRRKERHCDRRRRAPWRPAAQASPRCACWGAEISFGLKTCTRTGRATVALSSSLSPQRGPTRITEVSGHHDHPQPHVRASPTKERNAYVECSHR